LLRKLPIGSALAQNKEGKWMDLVFWESMEDAQVAAEEVMKLEDSIPGD